MPGTRGSRWPSEPRDAPRASRCCRRSRSGAGGGARSSWNRRPGRRRAASRSAGRVRAWRGREERRSTGHPGGQLAAPFRRYRCHRRVPDRRVRAAASALLEAPHRLRPAGGLSTSAGRRCPPARGLRPPRRTTGPRPAREGRKTRSRPPSPGPENGVREPARRREVLAGRRAPGRLRRRLRERWRRWSPRVYRLSSRRREPAQARLGCARNESKASGVGCIDGEGTGDSGPGTRNSRGFRHLCLALRLSSRASLRCHPARSVGIGSPCAGAGRYTLKIENDGLTRRRGGRGGLHGDWSSMRQAFFRALRVCA